MYSFSSLSVPYTYINVANTRAHRMSPACLQRQVWASAATRESSRPRHARAPRGQRGQAMVARQILKLRPAARAPLRCAGRSPRRSSPGISPREAAFRPVGGDCMFPSSDRFDLLPLSASRLDSPPATPPLLPSALSSPAQAGGRLVGRLWAGSRQTSTSTGLGGSSAVRSAIPAGYASLLSSCSAAVAPSSTRFPAI